MEAEREKERHEEDGKGRRREQGSMNVNVGTRRKKGSPRKRRKRRRRANLTEERTIMEDKFNVQLRYGTQELDSPLEILGAEDMSVVSVECKSPTRFSHEITQRRLRKNQKVKEKGSPSSLSEETEVGRKHKKVCTEVCRGATVPLLGDVDVADGLTRQKAEERESEVENEEENHEGVESCDRDVGNQLLGTNCPSEPPRQEDSQYRSSRKSRQQASPRPDLPASTKGQDAKVSSSEESIVSSAGGRENERSLEAETCKLPRVKSPRPFPHPYVVPDSPCSPSAVPVWTLPEETPVGVRLATITPQDILDDSVVEVCVEGLRGEHGSVTDPRLGPLCGSTGIPCATCASVDCLGHSGHIDLRQHVFHPSFVTRCLKTLQRLCYHCLGPARLCQRNLLKARKAQAAQRRQVKLIDIWLQGCAAAPVKDPNPRLCTKKQPRFRMAVREALEGIRLVLQEGQQQREVELSASTVRSIFARVPQRTWEYLGMKDPSDQVFVRYLRVCPTSCRPATHVRGILYPSRLTVRYNRVVALRNKLDYLNQQMEQLMNRQDEVVQGGVRKGLFMQVDALSCPLYQPGPAPAATRRRKRLAVRRVRDEDEDVNKDEQDEALPKEVHLNSDDGEEVGDVDKEKNDLNSLTDDGGEATYSTPAPKEWLGSSDDDDDDDEEDGVSEKEEQCGAVDVKESEGIRWDSEELHRTERLHLLKLKVEEVAAQLSALQKQARHTTLLLSAAVVAVIQEQMSKTAGKQGVLRRHLLGKRVNQCARAVFTGDNSLPLGVVGVPRVAAAKLFQYVHVHQRNLKECEAMVGCFPDYPSVVAVIRGERRFDLQKLRNKRNQRGGPSDSADSPLLRLRAGDLVQRHLMDGDQVVVSRQPTLAKANMETHTVRVTDTRTISLNISITDNYAADCDGDEINLFLPGVESHVSRLLDVEYNAVFPKSGKVSLRIKQDALRGAYSASLRDTFLTLEEFTALMPSDCEVPPPALVKPRRLWTGLQLLSLALPPSLTVDQVGVAMQLDALVVRHGALLSGVFDKGVQDKILECCKMFFPRETIKATVQQLQGVAERFVDEVGGVGFTFLPEDWSCPASTLDTMRQKLHDSLRRAQGIKCPLRRNAKLRQLLADQAKQLVPHLPKENNAAAMLKAGSKKRPQKLVQVCLAVGQHNQNDQLPAKELDDRRVLPFFSKDDERPQAEGFVDEPLMGVGSITSDVLNGMVACSSSYKKHCATGESGYLQRKLGKLMEDLTVRHDGTVRDANDEIVQLLYGDDGLLPECCVTVTLFTGPLPDHVADFYLPIMNDRRLARDERRLLRKELWSLWRDRYLMGDAKESQLEASVPFHLPHLMAHVLATVPAAGPPPTVTDVVGAVDDFFKFLDHSIEKQPSEAERHRRKEYEAVVVARRLQAAAASRAGHPLGPRPLRAQGGKLPEVNTRRELELTPQDVRRGATQRLLGDALATLKRYVRQHVNTLIVRKAGFSRQQFFALMDVMTQLYQESRPAAGECVGALAAQALAEPLMQMTLNACHRAAVASDGDAIPRLTKLLNGQAEDALLELWQGGLPRARAYLVQEIRRVYAAAGETVDVRHVRLVVDHMLKEGTMNGFIRHHVPPQTSFLKAAAFEQPLSLLQKAGRRGRGDSLRGVSENLILNETVAVGPDTCDTLAWVGLRDDTHTPSSPPPPPHPQLRQDASPRAGHMSVDVSLPKGCGFPDSDDEFTSLGSSSDDEAEAMTI